MEKYNLKSDIRVYCTTAKSFPEGIQEAFITLEKMLNKEGRTFYGISNKNAEGNIVYKAAVSESFEGEAEQYGFESFIIKKGEYLIEKIYDWRNHIDDIGCTFKDLLLTPQLDKKSSCIEWYKSENELVCMVKLNDDK